jgi:nucleoside phosphorylase
MDPQIVEPKDGAKEPPSLPPEQYTVGWICAIPTELIAARAMLDMVHARIKAQPKHDENSYTLGSIGSHNVVITCLEKYGVVAAAVAAKSMQSTFPRLRFGLMVGLGGGIPSQGNDIRLGDIAVSLPTEQGSGVVQYDLGRMEVARFRRVGTLSKPPKLLRAAITDLRATRSLGKEIAELVNQAFGENTEEETEGIWSYPIASTDDPTTPKDILFKADFNHVGKNLTCSECVKKSSSIVFRKPRKATHPRAFYGNIASGNSVMKNGVERDALAERDNVICFEMEAAGLMDDFPCLVIRGICDYADSHKNRQWQPYAAAVAAAYAQKLLSVISPEAVAQLEPIRSE